MKQLKSIDIIVLIFLVISLGVYLYSTINPSAFDVFWRREEPELLASDISDNSVILVNNNQPVDQLTAYLLHVHTGSTIEYLPDYITQRYVSELKEKDYEQVILLGYAARREHYLESVDPIVISDRTLSATNRLVNRMIYPAGTHFERAFVVPMSGYIDALNALPLIKRDKVPLFIFINENWLPAEVDEYTFGETILIGANIPKAYETLPNVKKISGDNRSRTSKAFFEEFYSEEVETPFMVGTSFYDVYQMILEKDPEQILLFPKQPEPPLY